MNKLLKVLITGTVINFMAVPFFYAQTGDHYSKLSMHSIFSNEFQDLNSFLKPHYLSGISAKVLPDSTILKDSTFTTKKVTDKKFKMKKKPWVAVLLSAALPGAGQFYNGSYWKVPVILGFAGYFGYEYWLEDKNYR